MSAELSENTNTNTQTHTQTRWVLAITHCFTAKVQLINLANWGQKKNTCDVNKDKWSCSQTRFTPLNSHQCWWYSDVRHTQIFASNVVGFSCIMLHILILKRLNRSIVSISSKWFITPFPQQHCRFHHAGVGDVCWARRCSSLSSLTQNLIYFIYDDLRLYRLGKLPF